MAATHASRGRCCPPVRSSGHACRHEVVLVWLCVLLLLLLSTSPAAAQVVRGWWPGNGAFEDPAKWAPVGMPGPLDTAAFLMPGVSQVTFGSDHATYALSPGHGYVGFLLGGHTYTVTSSSSVYPVAINVGFLEGVLATFELRNGTLAGQHAVIGAITTSGGTVFVDTGATWTNTGTLYVGYGGAGELNVQNGGVLTSQHGCIGLAPGSIGDATVTGTGSGWGTMNLSVGGSATAAGGVGSSLTVGDGGRVVASGTLKVWPFSAVTLEADGLIAADTFEGTAGCVATAAAGSELRVNHLVGWGDHVGSTAHFTLGHALGSGSGSLAVGAGQTLVAGQDLTVGYDAPATLAISGGGQVSCVNGYLGSEVGSTGTVTVTGAGSAWAVSGSLQVGDEDAGPLGATGTLNVSDGLVTADAMRLGDNGTVDVSGGEVHAATLHVGGTSGAGGTCSLEVNGGLVSVADTLTMGDYDPIINLNGGLLAADTFERGSSSIVTTAAGSSLSVNHLVGWGDHVAFGGNFQLGHALGSGSGSLTVGAGQTLTVGQNFTVGSAGTVTLDGGTIATQAFDRTAGTFDWNAGTLRFTSDLTVDTGQPFGASVTVGSGRDLEVAGTLTVGSAGTVTLDGGTITTTSFQNTAGGAFSHHDGTFTVCGGTYAPGTTDLTVNGNTPTALPHLVLDGVTVPGVYNDITIGDDAQGALTITGGGQVSSGWGYLGYEPGSTGTATVTGADSTWTSTGRLDVGGTDAWVGGTGSVTVQNGGQLAAGETLGLWKADSEVTANAGTLTAGVLEGTTGTIGITDPAGGTALTVGSAASGVFTGTLCDDTGPGSLTKIGTGTQTLAGAGIAYTGTTTVLDGILKLSDTTAIASAITNDATVEFEATTGTWTYDEALGGAGTFVKSGDGTLIISGPQDYDPGALFDIVAGTVEMNTDASGTELIDDAHLLILVTDATLNFGCDQHLDTLTIADGGLVRFTGASVVVLRHLVMDGIDLGPTTLTPEPATLALLVVGGLGLLGLRRRIA